MKQYRLSLTHWLPLFAAGALAQQASTHLCAQEPAEKAAAAAEPAEKEAEDDHDWLTFYYTNPEPENVVKQIKKWSDGRILSDERARPALVGFLSQVFRQNRDKIKAWYVDISDLPPEDLQTVRLAMIFSRTSEADEIIKEEEGDDYIDRRPPKVLEMSIHQRPTFDMLWGFFYATGSEAVIERMIYLFRYEEMVIDEDINIPDGYSPLYEQLPEAAHWALVSNAQQHPRVLEVLEKYYQTAGSLEPIERKGVRSVLSEVLPKKYPPTADDKKAERPAAEERDDANQ
jgi:hypothetical protein